MIDVNNAVENKGYLSEIPSSIASFYMMNQKIGDLE